MEKLYIYKCASQNILDKWIKEHDRIQMSTDYPIDKHILDKYSKELSELRSLILEEENKQKTKSIED